MDAITTIITAAKSFGVSSSLLLAVCTHESGDFRHNYTAVDKGSPSFGYCQIKKKTAEFLGFKGDPMLLNDPKINAEYAARYLRYQQDRYGDSNWVMLAGAYNAGSYLPSKKTLNCPKNLGYIKKVQAKLPEELRERLDCGGIELLAENP